MVPHTIKTIAKERGEPHEYHRDARRLVNIIAAQSRHGPLIRTSFELADNLHKNFYQDTRSIEELTTNLNDIGRFLDILDQEQRRWKARLRDRRLQRKELPSNVFRKRRGRGF